MWESVYAYLDRLALDNRTIKYVVIYIRGENLWGYYSTVVIGTSTIEALFSNDNLLPLYRSKGDL